MSVASVVVCALVVDYASLFQHPGEPVLFCLRTTDKQLLEGRLEQYDLTGTLARSDPLTIRAAAQIRIPCTDSLSAVKAKVGDETVTIRFLRVDGPLPRLVAQHDRLFTEGGELVVLRIDAVYRKPDRRWVWIKWAKEKIKPARPTFRKVSIILPEPYAQGMYKAPLTGTAKASVPAPPVAYPVTGKALPILDALRVVAETSFDAEAAILLTGFDEEYGTEPSLFREATEAILQILRSRKVRHIELCTPVVRPGYAPVRASYEAELQRIAYNYRLNLVSLGLSEDDWALDTGVYLAELPAKARERIHESLRELVQRLSTQ